MNNSELQIIVLIVIGLAVITYMAYKQLVKVQYLSLFKLWAAPLVLAVLNEMNLQNYWNNPAVIVAALGAFGLGAAIGLVRGSINRVSFDPSRNKLIVYGSLPGMLVWLGGLVLSIGLRVVFYNSPLGMVLSPAMVLGVFTGWRLVWQIKYIRLLPQVRLFN